MNRARKPELLYQALWPSNTDHFERLLPESFLFVCYAVAMSERQSYYVGIKGIIKNEAGDVLILKDASRGKWEVPGGRIDKDQSIIDSFSREIEEELPGAKLISLNEVIHVAQGDFLVENEHKLFLAFHLAKVSLPDVLVLSDEHSELAWVNQSSLSNYPIFTTDQAAIEISLR